MGPIHWVRICQISLAILVLSFIPPAVSLASFLSLGRYSWSSRALHTNWMDQAETIHRILFPCILIFFNLLISTNIQCREMLQPWWIVFIYLIRRLGYPNTRRKPYARWGMVKCPEHPISLSSFVLPVLFGSWSFIIVISFLFVSLL